MSQNSTHHVPNSWFPENTTQSSLGLWNSFSENSKTNPCVQFFINAHNTWLVSMKPLPISTSLLQSCSNKYHHNSLGHETFLQNQHWETMLKKPRKAVIALCFQGRATPIGRYNKSCASFSQLLHPMNPPFFNLNFKAKLSNFETSYRPKSQRKL